MSGQDNVIGSTAYDTYLGWLAEYLPNPFGGYSLEWPRYTAAIHEGNGKHVAAAIRQLSKDIHG